MSSLDIEKRFLAALLYSKLSVQDNFYAKQIPKNVFKVHTQEIDWIYRFRDRYGKYPKPADFRAKFHERLPRVTSPLEATLQPVLDLAMFEQMCRVQDRTKKLLDTEDDVRKALEVYKSEAQKLTDFSTDYEDIDLLDDEGADERYRELARQKMLGGKRILDTPWHSLNRTIGHMSFGEQVALSGRSSMGKSWMVSCWADYLARKGFRVGVFSKEMPGQQFQDRLTCLRYKLDYPDFREAELRPAQLRKWRILRNQDKRNRPKYFLKVFGNEKEGGMNYGQVVSKIKQYDLEVVFVDGAYLIRPPELPTNVSDTQRFTYLSNKTKELAKMLKVLWFVTLQDNRQAEDKKGNTKGGFTTVFGADAWAQDADWLLQMEGRRGTRERGLNLNKGRESNLLEFRINFKLSPRPNFDDLGPKPKTPVSKKLRATNVFVGVK